MDLIEEYGRKHLKELLGEGTSRKALRNHAECLSLLIYALQEEEE